MTVSVAYKRRNSGRLRWIGVDASTEAEAYAAIKASPAYHELLSRGFREYGISITNRTEGKV